VYIYVHICTYVYMYLRGIISVREPEARVRDVAGKVGIFLFGFDDVIKNSNIYLNFI
jgi:hypothetical protein